jgi:acetyl-CoA acyltransferase
MSRFGKHLERDNIDLACEASLGALRDAGLGMSGIGVLAVGNLWAANMGTAQRLQKQLGQTGIPACKVANAVPHGVRRIKRPAA